MNENYSKGAGMIAQERWEQVNKHGWDEEHDRHNEGGQLVQGALFAINPDTYRWPRGWDYQYETRILNKSQVDRLRVAGALIAAEIDRLLWLEREAKNTESIK